MERRVPNIDLINELVGWKPKISLEQIIIDVAKEIKLNKENGPQYL
jgi:nucleoside-diphosphate-sugar epimerase